MSIYKMFFAGSGGQGVLLMGQVIASAAMLEEKSSTFFPSYGPEMRGGTANCTVVVSAREVSCPIISEADCFVAMNQPSLIKYESILKPGGILLLNKSIIHQGASRSDISVIEVPLSELAAELGNARVANMIMLGAMVRATEVVLPGTVERVIRDTFGVKKSALVDINIQAFNYWQN